MFLWSMVTASIRFAHWQASGPQGHYGVMEKREAILARLHAAAQRLPQYESRYQSLGQRDYDHIYPLVRGYILDRFLLTEEMCPGEKLLDLADVSLRYMLALKRMGIDPGQISRSCSGASSVISKKVLLMKAVQEVFHVSMTPAEFAEISTVSELAAFISDHQQADPEQEPGDAGEAQGEGEAVL